MPRVEKPNWWLLNLDTKECLSIGNLRVWLPCWVNESLYDCVTLPRLSGRFGQLATMGLRVTQRSALFKLSTEVIQMIIADLRYEDALCFALTCKKVLDVARYPLRKLHDAVYSPWACCRLVLLSDTKDVPPGILTAAEREEIKTVDIRTYPQLLGMKYCSEPVDQRYELLENWDTHPAWELLRQRHGDLTRERVELQWKFLTPAAEQDSDEESGEPPKQGIFVPIPRTATDEFDGALFELFFKQFGAAGGEVRYPTGVRILCNLSKRVYIRQDTLGVGSGRTKASLAHALVVQICWSTERDIAASRLRGPEGFAKKMARGPWAGDKVCITSMDRLASLSSGREWEDVTSSVVPLLRGLWEEMGTDNLAYTDLGTYV
ncbi:hypothetical protein BD413DRAFT_303354 [Trametes elegans]|nr:hypothetical protein BD413DRAFT_303354 [Trametes elegans]